MKVENSIACTPYLPEIGINFFNPSFKHPINELKKLSDNKVALLGDIPPQDILANGTVDDVGKSVTDCLDLLENNSRVVLSCGGGMPPSVSTENIEAFYSVVKGS